MPLGFAARRGGVGGEGTGGRTVVPHLPSPGGWPVAPGPAPLLRRRIPRGYTCSAGVVGQPRAPGAAWPAVSGTAWQGGGAAGAPPPPQGLGRGSFSRPRQAGTKASRSVCAPPCILHSRVPLSRGGLWGAPERQRRAAGLLRALWGTRRAAAVVSPPGCRGPLGKAAPLVGLRLYAAGGVVGGEGGVGGGFP